MNHTLLFCCDFYPKIKRHTRTLLLGVFLFMGVLNTLSAQVSLTASSGTPTGTFTTLNAAFTAINAGTHTGTITISINGNTTEPATPIPLVASGQSTASYTTITIKPTVTAIISGATVTGRGVIELDGADNVTIDGAIAGTSKDLTIRNTAAATVAYNSAVRLLGKTTGGLGATSIIVKNCIIEGNTPGNYGTGSGNTNTTSYGIVAGHNATAMSSSTTYGDNYDNVTIENNTVRNAYRGISVISTTANNADNLVIRNNLVGSSTQASQVTFRGILVGNVNIGLIEGNEVFSMIQNAAISNAGISVEGTSANTSAVTISRNKVYTIYSREATGYGAYGINLQSGNNHILANNIIYDIQGTNYNSISTTFQPFGIRIAAGTGIGVYYNSVNMTGAITLGGSTTNTLSAAFVVTATTVTGLDVRNNIFANKMTSTATTPYFYAVWFPTSYNFTNVNLNNNAYHVSASARHFVGKVGGTFATGDYSTLANWRAISQVNNAGNDVASIPTVNADAPFTSDVNLTIPAATSTLAESGGIVIAALSSPNVDYTGTNRPVSPGIAPDMGAYEFAGTNPNLCSGTPAVSTTGLSANNVCPGQTVVASLSPAYTAAGITYQWQSSPDGIAPYTNVVGATAASYSLSTTSSVFVRAVVTCAVGGASSTSTPIQLTISSPNTVPYFEGFEGITVANQLPSCWAASNNPAICQTNIAVGTNGRFPRTGSKFGTFSYNTAATGDYFYTAAIQLTAGQSYKASVWYVTDATPGWTEFSILYGTTQSTTGLVNIASAPFPITNTAYQELVGTFVAPTTGTYYIAIKGVGPGFTPWYLSFDDLNLTQLVATDIAAISVNLPNTCYSASAPVNFVIKNEGTSPLDFSTNNAVATVNVTGQITQTLTLNINTNALNGGLPLAPNATLSVNMGTINMSVGGTYNFLGSITTTGDLAAGNNAMTAPFVRTLVTPLPLTYTENFNAGTALPTGYVANSGTWSILTGTPRGGVGATNGLVTNIYSANATPRITLPIIGSITTGATLTYAYRFTNYNSTVAATLGTNDFVKVQVSTDCGTTFTDLASYTSVTHTPTNAFQTATIPLTAYVGQNIVLRIDALRGAGSSIDVDLAFDNINIEAPCAGTPNGGTANFAILSICNPTNLGVTGLSSGLGITYQWESSTTSAVAGFADVIGATAATYLAPIPTQPTWYRLKTTCTISSQTSTSTTTEVRAFAQPITTYPYNEGFDAATGISTAYTPVPTSNPTNGGMPCGWTVQNVNGDPNTWYNFNAPAAVASTPNAMIYRWNTTSAANDWAFTPQFTFTAGKIYTVSFKAKASDGPTYVEGLEVRWGTAANSASMLVANTVYNNSNINSATFVTFTATGIAPTATGNYYIGFLAKSLADQAILYVDDIQVIESCPTIAITPATLPNGAGDVAYSQSVTQTGLNAVNGAITWSVSAGSLPTGLALNATTGEISGTPTAANTFNFTVQVAQGTCTATKAYSIQITCPPLVFTTPSASATNGTVGVAYTLNAGVTGNTLPVTYSISPTLPAGITLNTTTGAISGTPTTAAASTAYTVSATQGGATCTVTRAYTFAVTCPTLVFTTASATDGEISTPYTLNAGVTGNVLAVVYSISPALPTGITLNTTTGVISGTPTGTSPSTTYTVTATEGTCSLTKTYTFAILCANFVIAPAVLPNPTFNVAYTETLSLIGNPLPAVWTVSSGALPTGITLNSATGEVSGTAVVAGTFNFTITATQTPCTSTIVTTWTLGAPSSPLAAPDFPRNFDARTVSTTQINLFWQPVLQNVTEYRLYKDNVLIATLPITASSYQATGLTPDTFYSFTLIAVNQRVGEIKLSPPVSDNARTFPLAPVLISKTDVCGSGRSTVKVSSSGAVYRIYADSLGGSFLAQSDNATMEFPSVSTTTTFYVSVFSNDQESARTAVRIQVQPTFETKIIGESLRLSCDNSLELEAQEVTDATYTWILNGVSTGVTGRTITATSTGQYQVRIQKGVCNLVSEKVVVRLNQKPVAKIQQQNGVRFCENGTLNAASTNADATYEWLLNNAVIGQGVSVLVSQSGTYTLQVTQNGCQASTEVQVVVTPIPQVPVLVATESTICPTTETTISVQGAVNGVTYQWFRNGRNTRQTGSSITTSVIGFYSVRAVANDNSTCFVSSDEVEISRFEVEAIYLRISEDKKSLFLENAAGSQDGIASVEWYFEGEANASLGTELQITPTEAGNYSARVTNQNGCLIKTRTVYFSIPKPVITGEEDLKADLFKIYPNPSKGIFNVHFSTVLMENTQVSIFDATGKIINQQIFEKGNQEFTIDIQKFAKGMYLIRFNQNNTVYSKSIVIE